MHSQLMNIVMVALLVIALLELVYALLERKPVHSFRDTISSVSLGIGQQAINVYLAGGFLAAYAWIHGSVSLARADMAVWWHWVIVVFACDLAYYTGHRSAHSINLFVAAHVVHHHAEDFNLLSSLRQSWTAWILIAPFFLPLAFFGVPLEMFVYGQLGIMCFQFLSHTGVFRMRLGILDRIFITPRNHRVHHGSHPPYWGANCGGMFVLWDRVFGTYVEEQPDLPVRIGSGLELDFYDPFEANLDYYRRICFVSKHRRGLLEKIRIWFQSPQVLSEDLARFGYAARSRPRDVNRAPLSRREGLLIILGLATSVAVFAAHRALFEAQPPVVNLATGLGVMLSLWLLGRLLRGALPVGATPEVAPDLAAATSAPGRGSETRRSAMPRWHRGGGERRTHAPPS